MMLFSTILAQPDHDAARLLHVRLAQDEAAMRRAIVLVETTDEYLQSFKRQVNAGLRLTQRQLAVAHRRIKRCCLWLVQQARKSK